MTSKGTPGDGHVARNPTVQICIVGSRSSRIPVKPNGNHLINGHNMTQLTGAFSKQSILYYNFAVRRRSRAQVQHLASLALLSSPVAAHWWALASTGRGRKGDRLADGAASFAGTACQLASLILSVLWIETALWFKSSSPATNNDRAI